MARSIATISGIALAPGVSRNRRWYTPEHVAAAVQAARARITAGQKPMVMLTHHDAGDDSTRIAAHITDMRLDDQGRARYTAEVAGNQAGQDIAALLDTSDGQDPHLRGVSIRGHWKGRVRRVTGPDGQPVETADGLELDGLDFTASPGVDQAGVDTFAWAGDGQHETTEWVPITESVQEALVSFTEETEDSAPPRAPLVEFHEFDNGTCLTCRY